MQKTSFDQFMSLKSSNNKPRVRKRLFGVNGAASAAKSRTRHKESSLGSTKKMEGSANAVERDNSSSLSQYHPTSPKELSSSRDTVADESQMRKIPKQQELTSDDRDFETATRQQQQELDAFTEHQLRRHHEETRNRNNQETENPNSSNRNHNYYPNQDASDSLQTSQQQESLIRQQNQGRPDENSPSSMTKKSPPHQERIERKSPPISPRQLSHEEEKDTLSPNRLHSQQTVHAISGRVEMARENQDDDEQSKNLPKRFSPSISKVSPPPSSQNNSTEGDEDSLNSSSIFLQPDNSEIHHSASLSMSEITHHTTTTTPSSQKPPSTREAAQGTPSKRGISIHQDLPPAFTDSSLDISTRTLHPSTPPKQPNNESINLTVYETPNKAGMRTVDPVSAVKKSSPPRRKRPPKQPTTLGDIFPNEFSNSVRETSGASTTNGGDPSGANIRRNEPADHEHKEHTATSTGSISRGDSKTDDNLSDEQESVQSEADMISELQELEQFMDSLEDMDQSSSARLKQKFFALKAKLMERFPLSQSEKRSTDPSALAKEQSKPVPNSTNDDDSTEDASYLADEIRFTSLQQQQVQKATIYISEASPQQKSNRMMTPPLKRVSHHEVTNANSSNHNSLQPHSAREGGKSPRRRWNIEHKDKPVIPSQEIEEDSQDAPSNDEDPVNYKETQAGSSRETNSVPQSLVHPAENSDSASHSVAPSLPQKKRKQALVYHQKIPVERLFAHDTKLYKEILATSFSRDPQSQIPQFSLDSLFRRYGSTAIDSRLLNSLKNYHENYLNVDKYVTEQLQRG